jgi:hypothetical protein
LYDYNNLEYNISVWHYLSFYSMYNCMLLQKNLHKYIRVFLGRSFALFGTKCRFEHCPNHVYISTNLKLQINCCKVVTKYVYILVARDGDHSNIIVIQRYVINTLKTILQLFNVLIVHRIEQGSRTRAGRSTVLGIVMERRSLCRPRRGAQSPLSCPWPTPPKHRYDLTKIAYMTPSR